jgi:RluA family pseudouridine synthase
VNELGQDAVLWLDEAIVVVNKPAGLLAIRGGYGDEPFLVQVLEPQLGRLWVVHRLDRDTSGVIVLARSGAAHRVLNNQFAERRVQKVYHALVDGVPAWGERTIDLPLRRDGDRRHRTVVDPEGGKPARTQVRLLEAFARHALLEAIPMTGRTHQVRAHLSALGLPLAGDPLYRVPRGHPARGHGETNDALPDPIARTALHALTLTLHHPTTGDQVIFRAPYPADLCRALELLRSSGQAQSA